MKDSLNENSFRVGQERGESISILIEGRGRGSNDDDRE